MSANSWLGGRGELVAMSADDALGLLAEIAVAIAGFSSVVVVFGSRAAGQWSRADRIRLSVLVGGSLSVLFFALLPGLIRLLHGSEALAWGVSSVLLVGFILVWGWLLSAQMRGLVAKQPESLDPRIAVLNLVLNLAVVLLQLLNLIGPFDLEPGPYVVGLTLLLLTSAVQFVRLVFTRITH